MVGLLLCNGFVLAQRKWEKPPEKWSKDDALRIVTDSPWAKTYQSPESQAAAAQQQIARNGRDTVNRGGNGSNAGAFARSAGTAPIVVRLHSGLPIRQAVNRGRQIAADYDKMDETQKKQFDASSKGYLDCAICKEYYVISITQFPDRSGQFVDEGIFERFTFDDLKGNVWLENDKGERRPLAQMTPPKHSGESAYLFFSRKDDMDHTFLSPANKSFTLLFNNDFFTPSNPYAALVPRKLEFKIDKLMIGNDLVF